MACVLDGRVRQISDLPENLLLEIFYYLPVKDLCTVGRVCRVWRRVIGDNSLWRHVDLRPYRLNLRKMWKVIRTHFSEVLQSLYLKGYMAPAVANKNKPSLSDAMLKELQERCPNVKEFGLMQLTVSTVSAANLPPNTQMLSITSSFIPPNWFRPILEQNLMPDLRFLDLSNSTKTSNEDLKDLCSRKKIQTLKLSGCYRVTDEGLKTVAENLKELEVLEIAETQCTDAAVHFICRNLGGLVHLDMSRCSKVTDGGVATIAALLKKLQSLKLNGCYNIGEAALQSVANSLKHLTVLEISDTSCTDAALAHMCSNLVNLERLDLTRCNQVTDKEVINISKSLSQLKWLSLRQCIEVSDTSMGTFQELSCLRYLNVVRTKVTNSAKDELQAVLKDSQILLDNQQE